MSFIGVECRSAIDYFIVSDEMYTCINCIETHDDDITGDFNAKTDTILNPFKHNALKM